MELVYLLAGVALGFGLGWLVKRNGTAATTETGNDWQAQLNESLRQQAALQSASDLLQKQSAELKEELRQSRAELQMAGNELSKTKSENQNLNQRLSEQKQELAQLNEKFTKEFENLANRIFEEKTQKFAEQNKNNLGEILNPLGEKIKDFEKKVNEVYVNDSKERASLKEQLNMLHSLNQQMSKEAGNLTRALKGETKTQGNWGEFILESILEKSGLVKDREYRMQASFTNEEGRRLQPDVVVSLPEGKTLVIDSKVSLTAYEKFVAAEDEEARSAAIKEHLLSLRNHIKGLSDKNYQNLYQIKTLDFVLLFVPIEPAFALAVQSESQLFSEAFDKNIVLVSPSTLLATLRTVASIWRQENHNRNALDIARKAGDLYDKFNGFVEDMIDLGRKMDQSKNSYVDAMKKLSEGRGNLVNRVQELKKMGAITSKNLPPSLIERSEEE